MERYRKFIVALVGAGVIALNEFAGLDVGGEEVQSVVTTLTALLAALGVYGIRNQV